MDFSANAYLDVYLGHVHMIQRIQAKQEGSYHLLMKQLFSEAR